jgi:hypothetical protein
LGLWALYGIPTFRWIKAGQSHSEIFKYNLEVYLLPCYYIVLLSIVSGKEERRNGYCAPAPQSRAAKTLEGQYSLDSLVGQQVTWEGIYYQS